MIPVGYSMLKSISTHLQHIFIMAKTEQEKADMEGQHKKFGAPDVSKEAAKIEAPEKALEKNLEELAAFGGFDLLEGAIDGLENMNPEKKASKSIFLTESEFRENRENLSQLLELWIALLQDGGQPFEMVDLCKSQAQKVDKVLKKNLKIVFDQIKKLETSYRSVALFFANAETNEVEYLSVLNTDKNELQDSESKFFKRVSSELTKYYDRLNLKNNYSLLVIPGYLGSKQAVDIWGKIAHKNKVMLVTDFKDRPDFKMLKESLEKESLAGAEPHLANVLMTSNWLVGRKKYEDIGETEEFHVPPAGALAGKLYNTEGIIISQGAAGKKFGSINDAKGTRLDMLKTEIADLIDLSTIPMVFEDNRVMAFSNKSLFNGQPAGLQEYSIVRVFDWIGKVFMNFFNDVAFQNWNSTLKRQQKEEVTNFLDDYRGPGKLIEDYRYEDIRQDPVTKDITIEINIKPFFAARNFHIKLTGHEGKVGKEWEQDVK